LDPASFEPLDILIDFLEAGRPPVYVGFGLVVVDDLDRFTQVNFEAVKGAGFRALASQDRGDLGGDDVPDNIYTLESTPHDWLFRV
jgi:UDP:flavonoid glycosyltransferase YjiC (YdhE family)